MQDDLFGGPPDEPSPPPKKPASPASPPTAEAGDDRGSAAPRTRKASLQLIAPDDALLQLARDMPPGVRLGTSSWSYPGWQGLVWEGSHSEQVLSKQGLGVYSRHPLMRTVSIDRSFYRPLTATDYARYAAQVPPDFRFMVKAPSVVTDALVRSEDGRGREPNPAFLSPELAAREFVLPAIEGLGKNLGVLVFQLSPLPWSMLDRLPEVIERLRAMLMALPALAPHAPDGVMAVEVRDPQWLAPDIEPLFASALRDGSATYCVGLHAKMPPLSEQLQLLRRLWPGPLVCRWNLHPVHGPYGYAEAEKLYSPYDRIHHAEPELHAELARLINAFVSKNQPVYVGISNHAEGCAPLTVRTLAREIAALTSSHRA